ncbi:hypothetical protein ACFIQF_14325 [Comamonas sp. J-3]|uniref:hypothetical protein n=1 Tax=Comamonas trifloxystrobinivorans TaxID=3350256 RepID=UPI003726843D
MTKQANPFAQLARKPKHSMRQIDPDLLEIGNDPFTGKRAPPEGKYDALFRRLRVGQCIRCEPQEAGPLSNALRQWIQSRKRDDELEVRVQSRYHTDGRGRVWLLAKEQQLKKAA